MQQQTAPRKRSNWPFPAYPEPATPKRAGRPGTTGAGNSRSGSSRFPRSGPTRMGMLADICMVLVWGGSIPTVMWLGSAVGL